jgi:TP901 family phage tail tape measure protein
VSIGGVVLQFSADTRKATRDIDKLTRSIKDVGDKSKTADGQMKLLGKSAKLGIAGVAAGAAVGATAIAGLLAKSVSLAANFEESQNVLQSSLGATGEDMQKLSELAKKLGASTVFGAQDASNAMIELAKAGQTTAEIMGGSVAAAMALAATEGIELDRAAVILSQTMAQFGIKAKRAGKIVDILAAGATASTASVDDLSQGLKFVGSSAKGLKMPLKTTVTALAALNNKGLDASTAGTALNRMLLAIASPTKKAATAMEAYGINLVDAAGEMKPMTDVIQILDDKLGRLSSTERADVLKDIFAVEGGRAASLLIQTGVKDFEALAKAVDETGRAQEMADARTKGFKGALERLGGAAETIGIKVGEKLLPVLTGWIEDFTEWVDTPAGTAFFDSIADNVETAANNIRDYVADTLVPAIQNVYLWLGSTDGQNAIRGFGDAIQTVADAIGALADAFGALKRAYDKLPKWFRDLQGFAFEKLGDFSLPGVLGGLAGEKPRPPLPKPTGGLNPLETRGIPTRNVTVVVNNLKDTSTTESAALGLRVARAV